MACCPENKQTQRTPDTTQMTDAKHYFRLIGADAEEFASNLAHKCFLEDWCYLNPATPDERELCDLLVVFGNTAIIFQIKSLKIGSDGQYKASKVEKNIRQLHGARRRLLDTDRPLTLANPRRGSETFDPATIEAVHLVSVIVGEGENLSRLFHEHEDGSLSHMFSGTFLESAVNELDTVSDFVQYLAAKEEFHGTTQITVLGGEEELLAYYLLKGRTFDGLRSHTAALIDGGHWDELLERPEYVAKQQEDEISYAWDGMISRAHETGTPEYERVARELARPDRFGRRILAKAFLDGQLAADADEENDMFRRTMNLDGTTYCYLYMDDDHPQNETRRIMLAAMCHVARKVIPENARVIGIATEKTFAATCSYDFGFVHITEWTEDHELEAKRMQRELGLFQDPRTRSIGEDEYPMGR